MVIICRDVLNTASREYFDIMEGYIYNGYVNDYYDVSYMKIELMFKEFMIKHHRTVTANNKVIDEFELNPKNVPISNHLLSLGIIRH